MTPASRRRKLDRRTTTLPPKRRRIDREESALEALVAVLEIEIGDRLHADESNSSWWRAPPPFDDIDAVERAVRASENELLELVVQAFSGHFPSMLALAHQVDRSSAKLPDHALRIIAGIGALRQWPSVEQLDALEPGEAIIAYDSDRPDVAVPCVCVRASDATPSHLEPGTHSDVHVTCPFCWTRYRYVNSMPTGEPTAAARHFEHFVYMHRHVLGQRQSRSPDCHILDTVTGARQRRPSLWWFGGMYITITTRTRLLRRR